EAPRGRQIRVVSAVVRTNANESDGLRDAASTPGEAAPANRPGQTFLNVTPGPVSAGFISMPTLRKPIRQAARQRRRECALRKLCRCRTMTCPSLRIALRRTRGNDYGR